MRSSGELAGPCATGRRCPPKPCKKTPFIQREKRPAETDIGISGPAFHRGKSKPRIVSRRLSDPAARDGEPTTLGGTLGLDLGRPFGSRGLLFLLTDMHFAPRLQGGIGSVFETAPERAILGKELCEENCSVHHPV
jgi:hypothetical protein